jgi:hypothetical protein
MIFSKLSVLSPNVLLAAGFIALVGLSVARIHLRVQTTMLGYEIGRMKAEESRFLEDRSLLNMQLAKLTTRKNLQLMVDTDSPEEKTGSARRSSLAANH